LATATLRLKRDRDKPVRHRHPWVFSGGVMRIEGTAAPGDVVNVVADNSEWLAYASVNPDANLTARVLSWSRAEPIDDGWLAARITASIQHRRDMGYLAEGGACRLVFGESDGLPGLVVDDYAGSLVMSILTPFMERRRSEIVEALVHELSPGRISERSTDDTREREGLEPVSSTLVGSPADGPVTFMEGECAFVADIGSGQKTGFYLDQRVNRERVAEYASGRDVLNLFSYTGSFGIAALRAGASHVTNVDTSAEALAVGERMARDNAVDGRWESLEGNAFKVLRDYRDEGRRFGMIVIDPPKFASTRAHVEGACRGYKDLSLLGMKLLEPGGILATFSCSGMVTPQLFRQVVAAAAMDCGRDTVLLEKLTQPPDHPILMTFPESEYLKGFIIQAP